MSGINPDGTQFCTEPGPCIDLLCPIHGDQRDTSIDGCDDRLFEVVLLAPSTYLLHAPDGDVATRRALLLQPKDAACTGFPEVVSVREVEQR